jgi:hypothetical protein
MSRAGFYGIGLNFLVRRGKMYKPKMNSTIPTKSGIGDSQGNLSITASDGALGL